MGYQIAIDGPSGSGKSTLARNLANRLGIKYVDTGAMYRAVGYYMINNGIDLFNSDKIVENLKNICLKIEYEGENFRIILNEEDITEKIRTQEVADSASKVAALREVREKLVDIQREAAVKYDVVMEGRDIGHKVLKNADLKIFLDANTEVRTIRRINELESRNIACDYDIVKKEIEERDYRDYNREFDPLLKSEDAYYLDSSGMTEEEVIAKIITLSEKFR